MKTNINAIIQSKNGSTLVLEFPHSIYDLYEKLQSVGICQSPHRIQLSDEDGDNVRVKLYSECELGKHLLLTLSERNTLADANLLAFIVDNAKEEIRPALEQNILRNQYGSMQEVVNAARQMLYDSGPVKAVFYCPLVGTLLERGARTLTARPGISESRRSKTGSGSELPPGTPGARTTGVPSGMPTTFSITTGRWALTPPGAHRTR